MGRKIGSVFRQPDRLNRAGAPFQLDRFLAVVAVVFDRAFGAGGGVAGDLGGVPAAILVSDQHLVAAGAFGDRLAWSVERSGEGLVEREGEIVVGAAVDSGDAPV